MIAYRVVFFLGLLVYGTVASKAQEVDGSALFTTNCAACHTIGEGKLVGPDLSGVLDRHNKAWVFRFIRESQSMINEGDEQAVAVFNENNMIPMPAIPLSDMEIEAILAHISTMESAKAETKSDVEKKKESIKPYTSGTSKRKSQAAQNTSIREGILIGLWITLIATTVMIIGIAYALKKHPPHKRKK